MFEKPLIKLCPPAATRAPREERRKRRALPATGAAPAAYCPAPEQHRRIRHRTHGRRAAAVPHELFWRGSKLQSGGGARGARGLRSAELRPRAPTALSTPGDRDLLRRAGRGLFYPDRDLTTAWRGAAPRRVDSMKSKSLTHEHRSTIRRSDGYTPSAVRFRDDDRTYGRIRREGA
ncbi:hypothetical protein EVAR_99990_1 [Eumeta japonica]|uniref:Uncharacterized protein n=1 Tax=Eumeta variegata TaxID=151549 RepID=A0A4C1ZEX8_EUMVA|nr:hypothetical protein EVAR_99990_1 [Eumeta japonica]